LNTIPADVPFLIAGGVNASNAIQALRDVPAARGIDSASGIEKMLPD
jgi:phosphoribosylanthranilate isomerase